jgi:hypothetical protein
MPDPMAKFLNEQAKRIAELEDCIRALIETAHEPSHIRAAVIERARRTMTKD